MVMSLIFWVSNSTQNCLLNSTSIVLSVLPRKSLALGGRLTGFLMTSQSLPAASGVSFFHCWSIVLLCGLPELCPTSVSLTELSPPLGSSVVAKAAWDLGHRRNVSSVCMLYKIHANQLHPLNASIPNAFVSTRNTRLASNSHARYLQQVRCHISRFQRSFVPSAVRLWNMLDEGTCTASDVHKFKSASNKILKSLVN